MSSASGRLTYCSSDMVVKADAFDPPDFCLSHYGSRVASSGISRRCGIDTVMALSLVVPSSRPMYHHGDTAVIDLRGKAEI